VKIADNVFVVSGAGNGMGRHVVLELVLRGARVAAVDLDLYALDETLEHATGGDRVSAHVVDVTDRTAVATLPQQVIDAHGHVDALVNIAGMIHRFVHVTELTVPEMEKIMNVNYWGTVTMSLAFLPHLLTRPAASLTNMSSLSALIPFAGQTVYGASKGAVKQFSEGLYEELAGTAVTVSTIFPGNVSTDISKNSGVDMIDAGGRKVRATPPHVAAKAIVDGIERGRFRILVGSDARILDRLVRIAPRRATDLIARQMASVL
jgi:short-subunit dehydrogenase